jgi:hypothetical protein
MSFLNAKLVSARTARARELPLAAASAFLRGAPLLKDANGAWAECGADPALIGAFAESDCGTNAGGFSHFGTKEFPPGYMVGTLVQNEVVFRARYIGTLPAADGGSYGLTKDSDGLWKVDFSKTTTTARLKLVGRLTNSPENLPEVLVVVLAANVQVN